MISDLFLINENHGVHSWDPAKKAGWILVLSDKDRKDLAGRGRVGLPRPPVDKIGGCLARKRGLEFADLLTRRTRHDLLGCNMRGS